MALHGLVGTAWALVGAVLERAPDLVVAGAVLAVLVAVFQALACLHRLVMFWTRLALRLAWWAVLAGAVAVVVRRGPEAAARDVLVFLSRLAGYAVVVRDLWRTEYQKYDAQTKMGRGGAGRLRRSGA